MACYEISLASENMERLSNISPDFRKLQQFLPSFHWALRGSSGFSRFHLILLVFTGFYWVSLSFTGIYLVQLGLTRFH